MSNEADRWNDGAELAGNAAGVGKIGSVVTMVARDWVCALHERCTSGMMKAMCVS